MRLWLRWLKENRFGDVNVNVNCTYETLHDNLRRVELSNPSYRHTCESAWSHAHRITYYQQMPRWQRGMVLPETQEGSMNAKDRPPRPHRVYNLGNKSKKATPTSKKTTAGTRTGAVEKTETNDERLDVPKKIINRSITMPQGHWVQKRCRSGP